MKLDAQDILKKTATMLNKHELALYVNTGWNSDMTASQEDLEDEKDTLLFCLLEVYNEVASDYHPLYQTEQITVTNNTFNLTTLEKSFRSVKSIKNQNNNEISDYEIEYDNLILPNGTYTLKYRYLPKMNEVITDKMQNFDGKISESVMAYGTCAYYCLKLNIADSYSLWETKYKQALLISMQKTEKLYIKARRFV